MKGEGGGGGGGGSWGHRVVGGRDDGLEPKGGRAWGEELATGLGKKPVGGCYSAEMRRPAIRSTAHDPILVYIYNHDHEDFQISVLLYFQR